MQAVRLNHVTLVCYCVLYFMLSLPYLYQHFQHAVLMLIFNMVSKPHSCGHGVLSLRYIQEQSLSSFVFFFSLRSSSLASYCCRQNSPVQSCHRQKSHQHCKTNAFLKVSSQSQTSFKGSSQSYQISRFQQTSNLSLKGFVLRSNILLIQPSRVSSVDVGRQAEPRNSRVLLCSILYAIASASILAYST